MSQAEQNKQVVVSRPSIMIRPDYRMIKRRSDLVSNSNSRLVISNAVSLNGSRDGSLTNIQV